VTTIAHYRRENEGEAAWGQEKKRGSGLGRSSQQSKGKNCPEQGNSKEVVTEERNRDAIG